MTAMSARQFRLLVAGNRANDGCSQCCSPLAHDQADPAGGGMDQDGIASVKRPHRPDQHVHGHALQQHCSGLLIANVVGQFDQPVGGDQPRLGIAADRAGIGDTVSYLQEFNVRANTLDEPSSLDTRDERGGLRIETATMIYVDEIETDRGLFQPDLSGPRIANLYFLPRQLLRTTGLSDKDRMRHRSGSLL
jgi:hypothetical protein